MLTESVETFMGPWYMVIFYVLSQVVVEEGIGLPFDSRTVSPVLNNVQFNYIAHTGLLPGGF